MKATRSTTRLLAGLVGALALFAASCGDDDKDTTATTAPTEVTSADTTADTTAPDATVPDTAAPDTTMPDTTMASNPFEGALSGVFGVVTGACADGTVTGSYFRMVQAGGTVEAGPFIPNGDSACADTTYSLLAAGTDGGLLSGDWQAAPEPAFDATGNGLADSLVAPVKFFGVSFAAATDPAEAMPSITGADGTLTGDLSAFTAYYANGVFNQGAPKPDGSGTAATGTIDPTTGAFTLDWTSLIVGGSFDGFTGVWHLEGVFTPNG